MEVHMANLLVGAAPVVLEDVVLLGARSHDKLLDDRLRIDISVNVILYPITIVPACIGLYGAYQDLGQMVVGDVGQLLAVDLGNDELCAR